MKHSSLDIGQNWGDDTKRTNSGFAPKSSTLGRPALGGAVYCAHSSNTGSTPHANGKPEYGIV
jgi:hypothetical protein